MADGSSATRSESRKTPVFWTCFSLSLSLHDDGWRDERSAFRMLYEKVLNADIDSYLVIDTTWSSCHASI
jgi:hypothetical protein